MEITWQYCGVQKGMGFLIVIGVSRITMGTELLLVIWAQEDEYIFSYDQVRNSTFILYLQTKQFRVAKKVYKQWVKDCV